MIVNTHISFANCTRMELNYAESTAAYSVLRAFKEATTCKSAWRVFFPTIVPARSS